MTELHTQTWLLKRMAQMKAALRECEAYFEERADAEYFTDSAGPVGNEEARLWSEVVLALGKDPSCP